MEGWIWSGSNAFASFWFLIEFSNSQISILASRISLLPLEDLLEVGGSLSALAYFFFRFVIG